jgi:hypothetical protein
MAPRERGRRGARSVRCGRGGVERWWWIVTGSRFVQTIGCRRLGVESRHSVGQRQRTYATVE